MGVSEKIKGNQKNCQVSLDSKHFSKKIQASRQVKCAIMEFKHSQADLVANLEMAPMKGQRLLGD